MWRTRAVKALLVEEIAGISSARGTEASEADRETAREDLDRAARRGRFVVAVDWLAIVVLFLLRTGPDPWLAVGPTIETVFTLGILAVAIHSGFRLGQLERLRAVSRALDELDERMSAER